ncbi:MAG TPA: hypothetical protein VM557_02105 [Thermoanaerobaculia bacterium]|nr:hypothetical protein [Thermoanaerobaculia bacterium]
MEARQLELGVPATTEGNLARRGTPERDFESDPADGTTILRRNPMMRHLIEVLERGESIGHYGRLVFAMVGRHFLDEKTLCELLESDPAIDATESKALWRQVETRDYNPPRPERIAEWQRSQEFQICPEGDARECNVYRDLRFPRQVYEHIQEFWESGP